AQDRPDVSSMWQPNGAKPAKPAAAKPAAPKPAAEPVKTEPVKAAPAASEPSPADKKVLEQLDAITRIMRDQATLIGDLQERLAAREKADAAAVAKPAAPASKPAEAQPAPATKPAEPPAAPAAVKPAENPAPPAAKPAPVRTVESLGREIDSLRKEIVAADKRELQRVSGLGNFRFSGDVRIRYEPTFQGGGFVTRHRERSRARLNITGSTGSELSGGISFTTGDALEIQTENQTLSGFFTRKTIAFERFFVTYKPKWFTGFSLTAGKFPGTWARTGLTFSPDLYPEGISGQWQPAFTPPAGVELTVVGFWLPFLEVSGGRDSYITGGQIQTKWSLDKNTKLLAHGAILDLTGADAIATAVAGGTLKQAQPQSNTLRVDGNNKVTGYAAKFHNLDAIVGIEHAFSPSWPFSAQFNFTHNTRAAAGEQDGWWAEAKFGATNAPKQTQFGFTWFRIERDAVVSAFNASDLRLGSNSEGQIVSITHKVRPDLTAGFTGWFGRVLDPTRTPSLVAPQFQTACKTAPFEGCRDPRMSRLQFDIIYSF
ncbi:MAG TPA: putative porin, partial [Gemmatimonadales bacterium]|nr:putative porin [Gemmatimonadales bacterium]